MKDLLAKLDALHANVSIADDIKASPSTKACLIALHNNWPAVRAYVAELEKAAGYADSMLDFAAERGVEYDIARECLDRALCEVGIR